MSDPINPKRRCRWLHICWSEAAGVWLVDTRTDNKTEDEWTYLAFQHDDLKELAKRINSALRQGKKRMTDL